MRREGVGGYRLLRIRARTAAPSALTGFRKAKYFEYSSISGVGGLTGKFKPKTNKICFITHTPHIYCAFDNCVLETNFFSNRGYPQDTIKANTWNFRQIFLQKKNVTKHTGGQPVQQQTLTINTLFSIGNTTSLQRSRERGVEDRVRKC